MANNTVRPKNREEADKKLASDPATRRLMADEQGRQAAREGRSNELSSVTPIPQKKTVLQQFEDAFHALVDENTPEEKERNKKYSEELNETLQGQVDKKAKDWLITVGATTPFLVSGAGLISKAGAKGLANVLEAGATGVLTGGVVNTVLDDKKKAKAETVPTNPETNATNNGGTSNGNGASTTKTTSNINTNKPENTEDKTEDKTYDNYIAKVAKQQGLGKYVKEDGTVDYDKLQKSKVGYQILNALLSGIAGAAAGAAFKDAPDMSKSMLAQEVAKRNKVADEAQKTSEQEKQNALDLSTFTAKLGLQGKQALNAQKEMARFMSNLSYNDQVRMMNYMKGMSLQDAMKLNFAQNPYGAMNSLFGMMGGFGLRNVFK